MATQNIGARIDCDLHDQLTKWMDAQTVRPSLTAVIEEAVRLLIATHPVEGE